MHESGEILINTFHYEVGLREDLSSKAIAILETILIDPNNQCSNCYDITTYAPNDDSILLFQLRSEPTSTVEMYKVLENGMLIVLLGKITCIKNEYFTGN